MINIKVLQFVCAKKVVRIVHYLSKPAKVHQSAVTLSRIPREVSTSVKNEDDGEILPKRSYQDVRARQRTDPYMSSIITYLENGELPESSSKTLETVILSNYYELADDGLLYHLWQPGSQRGRKLLRRQLAIPRSLIDEVLYACHDDLTAGHLSFHEDLRQSAGSLLLERNVL